MNGPEHYLEAERLLATVTDGGERLGEMLAQSSAVSAEVTALLAQSISSLRLSVARAQVHATLALAAVQVDVAYEMNQAESADWTATFARERS